VSYFTFDTKRKLKKSENI